MYCRRTYGHIGRRGLLDLFKKYFTDNYSWSQMQRKCFRIMWYVNTWLYIQEHIIIFWTTKLIKILFSLSLNLIIRFAENDVHGFPKFQSEYEFHQAWTTRISFFLQFYILIHHILSFIDIFIIPVHFLNIYSFLFWQCQVILLILVPVSMEL